MPVFDDESIVFFAPKSPKSIQKIYAVHRKGEELNEYASSFIKLFADAISRKNGT